MIIFQVTKKFQDTSGLKASNDHTDVERFFSWHVDIFPDNRRSGVIFMNDLTRYSVILFGLKKADFKDLLKGFNKQLKNNMEFDGYKKDEIETYLTHSDEFILKKTSDRSVLGSLKNHLLALPYWMDLSGVWDHDKITYINTKLNDTPMTPLEREGFKPFPKDAMKEALKSLK